MDDGHRKADWYVVSPTGDGQFNVVGRSGGPVRVATPRPLRNVLRGAELRAARRLAESCISAASPADTGGVAEPVLSPDGLVVQAVVLSIGYHASLDGAPEIGSFRWVQKDSALPPVLELSSKSLDLLGVAPEHRDRSVYGPSDFFTRTARLSDVLEHTSFLYDGQPGDTRARRTAYRRDDGNVRELISTECVESRERPRIITGLLWDPQIDDRADAVAVQNADMDLAMLLANHSGQSVAIGDLRFPAAPYYLRWVTPVPPGVAHGASTGQPSSILDEDLGRLIEYAYRLGKLKPGEPVPTLRGIRVRRAGGGVMTASGQGYQLHPRQFPTVWVVVASYVDQHPDAG